MTQKREDEIVIAIQQYFPTFGGIRKGDHVNPLTHWLEDKPASFAMGVEVRAVVRFIAAELKPRRKGRL